MAQPACQRDREDDSITVDLDSLRAALAAVEARVVALEAGRGSYADSDVRLLIAIHDAAEGLPFKARSVLVRADDQPALRKALRDAWVRTPVELGNAFSRMLCIPASVGVRLEKVRHRRGGWWWRTVGTDQQCNGDTRDDET